MSKAIIYAGVSRLNGELKFRTATSKGRVIQLGRTDTDLKMVEISPVATKAQAAKILLATDFESHDAEIVKLLTYKTLDENPFALSKKKDTVVVKVPTKFARELTGAKVEVSEKMSAKEAAKIRNEFNARVKEAYEAN